MCQIKQKTRLAKTTFDLPTLILPNLISTKNSRVGLKNANFKDVHYTVEQELRAEYFAMIDDLLVVQSKLRPGTYRITIKAQAIPNTLNGPAQTNALSVESYSLKMGKLFNYK